MAIDYNLHPIYDVRVGMDGTKVETLLGKPTQIRPIAPGHEMWLYANKPTGHFIAAVLEAGKLTYLDLRLDRDPEPITVMNMGELGVSTAMSVYGVSAAASLLQQIGPVSDAKVRDIKKGTTGYVSARTDPPGTALKHLKSIMDRGLELPGARAHLINPRTDQTGVQVLTRTGSSVETVRDDRISYLWLMPDDRILVMEVRCEPPGRPGARRGFWESRSKRG